MTYAPSAIGGDFTHMLFADMAVAVHLDPIPHLVGHNPQLLLTASPEAEAMSALAKVGLAAVGMIDEARRMWDRIYPHRIAIIDADNVTRETLDAAAGIKGLREIVINIESPSGELSPILPGPPMFRDYKVRARDHHYRDYTPTIESHDLRTVVARARRQPTYLKHDPSKRHGRGRRKR